MLLVGFSALERGITPATVCVTQWLARTKKKKTPFSKFVFFYILIILY